MPVAGVASARARLFEQGFGGLALEDDDYREKAHMPGIIVKAWREPAKTLGRVPLPERFRCNGHQRHCKSLKQEINGEIVEFGEEDVVTGKPKQRASAPRPMPAGAVRAAGVSSAPVEARQEKGATIGQDGIVMGMPASAGPCRPPFHQYLSDSLGRGVVGIYFKVRNDQQQRLEQQRSSRSSSSSASGDGSVTHLEKLEEGPDGMSNYPFVAGMQIFVDLEGGPADAASPSKRSSCTIA